MKNKTSSYNVPGEKAAGRHFTMPD